MNFSLFSCILIVHIAGGTIGLVTGLIGMISPKGKKLHRGAGKIFFLAMALIFVSSIYMSVVKQNWFLFFIGFFSFYLAATGYRILALKTELEKFKAAARATAIKDKRVNIRLSSGDLKDIQVKALEEGIPYQTLIASVLHKYVTGKLVDAKIKV